MIVPLFVPARWRGAPGEGIEIGEDGSALPVTELLPGLSEPR
jgi:hypothetical protein